LALGKAFGVRAELNCRLSGDYPSGRTGYVALRRGCGRPVAAQGKIAFGDVKFVLRTTEICLWQVKCASRRVG